MAVVRAFMAYRDRADALARYDEGMRNRVRDAIVRGGGAAAGYAMAHPQEAAEGLMNMLERANQVDLTPVREAGSRLKQYLTPDPSAKRLRGRQRNYNGRRVFSYTQVFKSQTRKRRKYRRRHSKRS